MDPAPARFPDAAGHWGERFIELLHRTQTIVDKKSIVEGYSSKEAVTSSPTGKFPATNFKITLMSTCAPWRTEGVAAARSFTDVPEIVPMDASEDLAPAFAGDIHRARSRHRGRLS